jgi:hypothetical protein
MTSLLRWVLGGAILWLTFVVNPGFVAGCADSGDDVDWAAVEAELVAELDGVNDIGGWEFPYQDATYEVLLALSQANGEDQSSRAPGPRAFGSVAHACGRRTFFQSASACDTQVELAVEGSLTLRRLGEAETTVASDLPVTGRLYEGGGLELSLAGGGTLSVERNPDNGRYQLGFFEASNLGTEKLDVSFDRDR